MRKNKGMAENVVPLSFFVFMMEWQNEKLLAKMFFVTRGRNLLRLTRLPTRKRRSNVSNPILKITDFQSGSIPTESQKKRQAPTRSACLFLLVTQSISKSNTGISSKMNIPSPCDWRASSSIFGWGMRTHATYVAGFEAYGSPNPKNEKSTPKGVLFRVWWPVRESNPCYSRERAVS